MRSVTGAGLESRRQVMEIRTWNHWIFGPADEFWPELNFSLSKVTVGLCGPTPGATGDAIAVAQPYPWNRSR